MRKTGIALLALQLFMLPATADAVPIVEVFIQSNDGISATVTIDLTMPDEGLLAYSFSVSFDGTLSFDSGDRVTPPGMIGLGSFDNGGAGPGIITLIAAASSAVIEPVGVGGETFRVANLTFGVNGSGGLVQSGAFFTGVDGFVISAGDFQEDGSFGGANVGLFSFGAQLVAVPEPSTGLLVALGLVVLSARRFRARAI